MIKDSQTGGLVPVNYELLQSNIPEINKLDIHLDIRTFSKTIDSSEIEINHWIELVSILEKNYDRYHGFVILHGSDTMAYSASALSFMIENLSKPVIFTGSQLPIGVLRTDAKENFITSLELAASGTKGKPAISDVCIYFEYHLLKGNRTTKSSASQFKAFQSANYPALAEAGVEISFLPSRNDNQSKSVKFHKKLNNNIALLKLFPGMSHQYVEGILRIPGLRAVVMETFGSGNAPTVAWFIDLLSEAIQKNILIVNVTQCISGAVQQGKYKTSEKLMQIGVISGHDITTESAITKLMFLLGNYDETNEVKKRFSIPLCGEMTLQELF